MKGKGFATVGIVSAFLFMTAIPAFSHPYAGEPAAEAPGCGNLEVKEYVDGAKDIGGTNEIAGLGAASGSPSVYRRMRPAGYIYADLDIDPDNINLRSQGRWFTAYIELPAGMDPLGIEVGTLQINSRIPAEPAPVAVQDHDVDGIPDLMVKFQKAALYLMVLDGLEADPTYLDKPVEMTVKGVAPMLGPVTGTDWVIIRCTTWARDVPINRINTSIAVITFQTPAQVGTTWWSVTAQLRNPALVGIPNKTLKFYWRTGTHTGIGENCVSQNIGCPINMVTNAAGTTSISVGFAIGGSGMTTHVDVYFGGDCFYWPSSASSGAIHH